MTKIRSRMDAEKVRVGLRAHNKGIEIPFDDVELSIDQKLSVIVDAIDGLEREVEKIIDRLKITEDKADQAILAVRRNGLR